MPIFLGFCVVAAFIGMDGSVDLSRAIDRTVTGRVRSAIWRGAGLVVFGASQRWTADPERRGGRLAGDPRGGPGFRSGLPSLDAHRLLGQLRPLLAQMLGLEESAITQGRMSYELRRLRLHGLIQRVEKSHRYRLTQKGLTTIIFYRRLYGRLIRPVFSVIEGGLCDPLDHRAKALKKVQSSLDAYIQTMAA